jgi:glyoxylate/hydroxypyruvate reductase A
MRLRLGPMKITFCCTDAKPEPWLQGFSAALPGVEISVWQPGAPQADYAVVWAPPQQFMDEQPGLKALFNIGAGVDALLKLRLPPQALVVRLDDAGMAVQMAEYVCHAVIRHFREFDGYEADTQAGRWGYRKPRLRSDYPIGVMGLGVLGERVAKALAQFDFPINGWSRSPKAIDGVRGFAGADQFNDFLAASRVLVNLLPLTPDTANVINKDTLGRLLPGAYVINVARGAHLVDEDLVAAIDSGHARCVPHRAVARRPCVLDAPTHHRHAPHVSAHAARREHCPDRTQDGGAGARRGGGGRREPRAGLLRPSVHALASVENGGHEHLHVSSFLWPFGLDAAGAQRLDRAGRGVVVGLWHEHAGRHAHRQGPGGGA